LCISQHLNISATEEEIPMQKSAKKLVVAKETLRRLELRKAGGATFDPATMYASSYHPWELCDCPEYMP
jgi:hypothetical protein